MDGQPPVLKESDSGLVILMDITTLMAYLMMPRQMWDQLWRGQENSCRQGCCDLLVNGSSALYRIRPQVWMSDHIPP